MHRAASCISAAPRLDSVTPTSHAGESRRAVPGPDVARRRGNSSPEPLRHPDRAGLALWRSPDRQRGRSSDATSGSLRARPHPDLRLQRRRRAGRVRRPAHRPGRRRRRPHARGDRTRVARVAHDGRGARRHPLGRGTRPPGSPRRGGDGSRAAHARLAEPAGGGHDRARLPRHHHAAGDPAQRARGPLLVHRLHALPAGDLPGPPRGAAQLPDRRRRPDRPAHRQRLAARRGHRRGGGDDARTPRAAQQRPGRSSSTPTRSRRPSTSCGPAPRGWASRSSWPTSTTACPKESCAACWSSTPVPPAPSATRGRSSRPPTSAGPWPWSPPTSSPSPCSRHPAPSAPTSWSARRSASAYPSSTAVRTPGSCRSRPVSNGTCPAAWSGCPSTPRVARPTGSPSRPASSTSGATRRPPTSAPHRCCSPSWRRCTPSTTAPRACVASRSAPMTTPAASPRRCGPGEWRSSTTPGSTR